jgi:tRNA(adenine34) deaminase
VEEGQVSATMDPTHAQRDTQFMEMALRQAEAAVRAGQAPFGAVVVDRDGTVIGEGYNRVRVDLDPTAHGEIVAIRAAWRRVGDWPMLAGGTLYTTCEPCLLCSFVIARMALKRVVFAARATDMPGYRSLLGTDFAGAAAWVNAQEGWPRLDVLGDFMRDRALKLMSAFPWAQAGIRATIERSS